MALAALLAGAGAGCLEPLVSDEPGASLYVLPPGSTVPHVSESPSLTAQIRVNDGLSDMTLEMTMGVVTLKKGWADGVAVMYWDFGDTSGRGAQLYVLVRREGENMVPIDHPWVADTMPGDTGYSPLWFVQHVVVTETYAGEVLPSVNAIVDAVELGLVEEPVPAQLFLDGPIVPQGTKLDMGMGVTPAEAVTVYARGWAVDMLPIGGDKAFRTLSKPGTLPRGDVHRVWEGNAVMASKEPVFQNGGAPWTPAVRVYDCRVTPSDPADPTSKIDDEAEMFVRNEMGTLVSVTDRVTSWAMTTSTKHWPILVTGGTP